MADLSVRETEIGPIPADWELRPLDDVAEKPQYGLTATAQTGPVGPKFLRITDIQDSGVDWDSVPYCEATDDERRRCRLRNGDLVVARIGATTGKTYLIHDPPEAVFASYLIRIRTLSDMLPDFLNMFTKSSLYWNQVNEAKGGRLKKGVNIPNLQSLLVPIPPLAEQRAIAHVMRAVQQAKKTTEKVIAAAQQFKASLMRHLFTYGAVPFAEADQVELKETPFGQCPAAWVTRPLGEVVTITSGQVDPRHEPHSKMLHVGPENIEEATGRIVNAKTAEELRLISGKYHFGPHDVLYSKIRPYLRKAALPDFEGICSADMYPLKPRNGLQREYLFSWLLSEQFTQQAVSFQERTGIPKINRQQLEATQIAIPPSGEDQRVISTMLLHCDQKANAEARRAASLGVLFESLLHNLMTGTKRVADLELTKPTQRGRKRSPLSEIFGKWPGDETDEQVRKALEEMD